MYNPTRAGPPLGGPSAAPSSLHQPPARAFCHSGSPSGPAPARLTHPSPGSWIPTAAACHAAWPRSARLEAASESLSSAPTRRAAQWAGCLCMTPWRGRAHLWCRSIQEGGLRPEAHLEGSEASKGVGVGRFTICASQQQRCRLEGTCAMLLRPPRPSHRSLGAGPHAPGPAGLLVPSWRQQQHPVAQQRKRQGLQDPPAHARKRGHTLHRNPGAGLEAQETGPEAPSHVPPAAPFWGETPPPPPLEPTEKL